MIAVITADLIDSTKYKKKQLEFILEELQGEFAKLTEEFPGAVRFDMFRGDSFQVVLQEPSLALRIALRLKATVTKAQIDPMISKAVIPIGDVRLAIGVGEGEFPQQEVHTANGMAYQYSGRLLDGMKSLGRKTQFQCADANINAELDTTFAFLDNVTDRWSVASSEVVYYLLKGYKEQEIADQLDRSQAAINLRKKAASWQEIQGLLRRFESLIKTHCHE